MEEGHFRAQKGEVLVEYNGPVEQRPVWGVGSPVPPAFEPLNQTRLQPTGNLCRSFP